MIGRLYAEQGKVNGNHRNKHTEIPRTTPAKAMVSLPCYRHPTAGVVAIGFTHYVLMAGAHNKRGIAAHRTAPV
jgi:hypothetical protein